MVKHVFFALAAVYFSFASFASGPFVKGRLEFNGYIGIREAPRVSIYDKKLGVGAWLELGQSYHGLQLTEVDLAEEKITLIGRSQLISLALKKQKVRPLRVNLNRSTKKSAAEINFAASMQLMFERGQEIASRR